MTQDEEERPVAQCACGCGAWIHPVDMRGRPRLYLHGSHARRLPTEMVKEHTDARARAYRAANRATLSAKQRDRYKANPEPTKAQLRRWRQEHPEKVKLHTLVKHHKHRGAAPDKEGRKYVQILLKDPCSYCGARVERPEIDHIVSVADGGRGNWENLTAACRNCNAAKGGKSLLGFLIRRMAS